LDRLHQLQAELSRQILTVESNEVFFLSCHLSTIYLYTGSETQLILK